MPDPLADQLVSDDEDDDSGSGGGSGGGLSCSPGSLCRLPPRPLAGHDQASAQRQPESTATANRRRAASTGGNSETLAARVGGVEVVSYADGRRVPLRDFWAASPCVLVFLRRFGCPLCRTEALEASALHPLLAKHGVRFVGIGMDAALGDFARYFTGELYRDADQAAYKALGLSNKNPINLLDPRAIGPIITAMTTVDEYNFEGNYWQMGGTFVMARGGECLLAHHQQYYGDYADADAIMAALGYTKWQLFSEVSEAAALAGDFID